MTPDEEFSQYAGSRWPQLVRSAVFLGARPADAEDVAQGVLAQVWRSWRRKEARGELRGGPAEEKRVDPGAGEGGGA